MATGYDSTEGMPTGRRDLAAPPVAHFESLARAGRPRAAHEAVPLTLPKTNQVVPVLVECSQPLLDAKSRIAVTRAAKTLGWNAGLRLSAHVVVRPGGSSVIIAVEGELTDLSWLLQGPTAITFHLRRRLDRQCRLQLSPSMVYALRARPKSRVQVVADPDSHVMALAPLNDASSIIQSGAYPQRSSAWNHDSAYRGNALTSQRP